MRLTALFFAGIILTMTAVAQDKVDIELAKAVLLKKQKQYAKASQLFQKIASQRSVSSAVRAEALYQSGRCLLADGKVEQANKTFSSLLTRFPKEAEATAKILNDLESAREVLFLRRKRAAARVADPFIETPAQEKIRRKLKEIVVKEVEFKDLTIQQVLDLLRKQSKLNDPEKKGLNFLAILDLPRPVQKALARERTGAEERDDDDDFGDDDDDDDADFEAAPLNEVVQEIGKDIKVSASGSEMSLRAILDFLCQTAGAHYEITDESVLLLPNGLTSKPLRMKIIPIDPRLMRGDDDEGDIDFRKYFEDKGVRFPVRLTGERAGVSYDRGTSSLIFRNTAENLASLETIMRVINMCIPQVKIAAELMEVDVPTKMTERFRTTPTANLLLSLPIDKRKSVSKLVVTVQSGKETYITNSQPAGGDGKSNKRAVANQQLTVTPQVAEDGISISLDLHWTRRITPEALILARFKGADVAGYVADEKDVRTEITLWDGSSSVMQVAAADKAKKKGALYLVITASIVSPDDKPRADTGESDNVEKALQLLLKEE